MLAVEELTKRYPGEAGPVDVLAGVSFTLAPGETLALTGDSGVRASFELYTPAELLPAGLRLLGFFDVGVWDREEPLPGETASDSVASVGLGARWAWNNALSLSLDYGKTIVASRGVAPGSQDIDDTKLHFNVFYTY